MAEKKRKIEFRTIEKKSQGEVDRERPREGI
jgi:hypothetical protein